MYSRFHQWAFIFLLATFIAGCTTTSPVIRIFPKDFPKVGHRTASARVQGEDCGSQSILWLRLMPGPKIYNAIQNALARAGTSYNALTEVKVYEQMHGGILLTYHCVIVEGLPVRYGQAAAPDNYIPSQLSNPKGTKESQWNF